MRNLIDIGYMGKESAARGKYSVPSYMLDIYKNGITSLTNSSPVDVVKGVTPAFFGPFLRSEPYANHGTQEIAFDIPKSSIRETLVNAEIRIMTDEVRNLNVSVQVYRRHKRWIFLDEKKVPLAGGEWISLNVNDGAEEFRQAPAKVSFLLVFMFAPQRGGVKRHKLTEHLRPVLLLSYSSRWHEEEDAVHWGEQFISHSQTAKTRSRKKRSLLEEFEEETNSVWDRGQQQIVRNTCRRKPLYVEFSEIDYDTWIVAPTGYQAFQCVGKCTFPVGEHLSPTKHAIVQTLMHHVSPAKVGRACCVPTRLDPISVLYVDSKGTLTYRFRYRDMVVAECGCR